MNSSPTTQPQRDIDKLHFLDYWQVITKRKEVIIATTVILIFAVTVYSFVARSQYTGVAQIRIDPTPETVHPFTSASYDTAMRAPQRLDEIDFNTHQSQIVSMPVLRKVIEGRLTQTGWRCEQCGKDYTNEEVLSYGDVKCTREGCGGRVGRYTEPKFPEWVPLNRKWATDEHEQNAYDMDLAVEILHKRVSVQPVRGTRLINIYYTSPDRNEVHRVANMIAEVYKQHQEETSRSVLDEALSVLSEELDRLMRGRRRPSQAALIDAVLVPRRSTDREGVSDPLVARALTFIDSHRTERIGPSDVVAAMGVDERYLQIHFRRAGRDTVHGELAKARVEHAKLVLADPHGTIHTAAFDSGFANYDALLRAFKRHAGMSPGAWRRQALLRRQGADLIETMPDRRGRGPRGRRRKHDSRITDP